MKFQTLFTALCILFFAPSLSMAESPAGSVLFNGEAYVMQQENDKDYVRTAEFVRPQEDLASWTRLIAIRHHPRLMNPHSAAIKLGRELQEQNPGLTYEVTSCNNGTEAIIEFTLRPADGSLAEFNAWRFMKRDGYSGLISYQFAHRGPAISFEKAALTGQDWVSELARVNFDYRFAKLGKEAVVRRP